MGVTIQKQNEFNGWKNDVSIYYEQVERIIKEETVALQKVVKQVAQTAINTLKDERAKLIESRTSLFNKLKETTDEISHDGDFLLPIPKVDVNDYKKKFEEMQKYLNDFDAIKAIKVEEDEAMEHLPLIDPSSIIQADSTHEVSIHSQWAAASGKFAVRMQDPTVERILSQFSMHTRRNAFAKDLKSFKESSIPVEKGAKVLTVYQNSYYRAKIVDIKPETERCRVQIVDYGNLEGRNYDEIWPYTEDALGFSEPVQMIECALSEEVMADPKSPKYTDARWTFNRHVQKYMQDTAGKGVFLATFRKKVNYKEDSAWLIDLEVEQDGCKLSLSDIVREKMGDGPDKSNICRDIRYAPDEIQTHIVKTKSEADESGESSQSQEQVAPPEADAITTAAMAAVNSILQGVVDLSVPPPPLSLPTSDGDGNTESNGKSMDIENENTIASSSEDESDEVIQIQITHSLSTESLDTLSAVNQIEQNDLENSPTEQNTYDTTILSNSQHTYVDDAANIGNEKMMANLEGQVEMKIQDLGVIDLDDHLELEVSIGDNANGENNIEVTESDFSVIIDGPVGQVEINLEEIESLCRGEIVVSGADNVYVTVDQDKLEKDRIDGNLFAEKQVEITESDFPVKNPFVEPLKLKEGGSPIHGNVSSGGNLCEGVSTSGGKIDKFCIELRQEEDGISVNVGEERPSPCLIGAPDNQAKESRRCSDSSPFSEFENDWGNVNSLTKDLHDQSTDDRSIVSKLMYKPATPPKSPEVECMNESVVVSTPSMSTFEDKNSIEIEVGVSSSINTQDISSTLSKQTYLPQSPTEISPEPLHDVEQKNSSQNLHTENTETFSGFCEDESEEMLTRSCNEIENEIEVGVSSSINTQDISSTLSKQTYLPPSPTEISPGPLYDVEQKNSSHNLHTENTETFSGFCEKDESEEMLTRSFSENENEIEVGVSSSINTQDISSTFKQTYLPPSPTEISPEPLHDVEQKNSSHNLHTDNTETFSRFCEKDESEEIPPRSCSENELIGNETEFSVLDNVGHSANMTQERKDTSNMICNAEEKYSFAVRNVTGLEKSTEENEVVEDNVWQAEETCNSSEDLCAKPVNACTLLDGRSWPVEVARSPLRLPGEVNMIKITSSLDDNGQFWGQLIKNTEEQRAWENFEKSLNEYFPLATSLSDDAVRHACDQTTVVMVKAAQTQCRRANILHMRGRNTVTVREVDYGTVSKYSIVDVKELLEKFDMDHFPCQAFCCSLASRTFSRFAVEEKQVFEKELKGKIVHARNVMVENGKHFVTLTYDGCGDPLNNLIYNAAVSSNDMVCQQIEPQVDISEHLQMETEEQQWAVINDSTMDNNCGWQEDAPQERIDTKDDDSDCGWHEENVDETTNMPDTASAPKKPRSVKKKRSTKPRRGRNRDKDLKDTQPRDLSSDLKDFYCANCYTYGHLSKKCPKPLDEYSNHLNVQRPAERRKVDRKKDGCYTCGGPHMRAHCPKRKEIGGPHMKNESITPLLGIEFHRRKESPVRTQESGQANACFNCGELGHLRIDCSNKCIICKKAHRKVDCPQAAEFLKKNPCKRCKKFGHFMDQCRQVSTGQIKIV